MASDMKPLDPVPLVMFHLSRVTFKIGAHGRIRTCAGDALDVVPLLVGLREQSEHERISHCVNAMTSRFCLEVLIHNRLPCVVHLLFMKRTAFLLVLILTSLTLASSAREIPVVAPAKAGLSETKLAEIGPFMERQVADQKLAGGIVMVSHGGKIGFFHTYGLMDREVQKPMAPDTIFRIYSMSKAITTAAALNLYDAGKIGLDDPVSKYIPSFANLMVATTK